MIRNALTLIMSIFVLVQIASAQATHYVVNNTAAFAQRLIDNLIDNSIEDGIRQYYISIASGDLVITPNYDSEDNVLHSSDEEQINLREMLTQTAQKLLPGTRLYKAKIPREVAVDDTAILIKSIDGHTIAQHAIETVGQEDGAARYTLVGGGYATLAYDTDRQQYRLIYDGTTYVMTLQNE